MELSRRALLSFPRSFAPATGSGFWLHLGRPAMACKFEITLPSELGQHLDAAQAALDAIDGLEEQLSIFRASSELSEINRAAALGPVTVEPRLHDLLVECERLHRETEGAFDITSTPLSKAWGFLRREGRVPTPDELGEARARVGMKHVVLDAVERTVSFGREGVSLNLGSIGKGYALDRVGADLRAAGVGTALLSAGSSSLLAVGDGAEGAGYVVGLRDPFDHQRRLGTVRLAGEALGVSGVGEQSFAQDGRRYGHLLDPRNGQPVEGRALVAVVAPSAARADALATAFFVGGPDLARRYVEEHPEVTTLVIDMPLEGQRPAPRLIGRPSPWSLPGAH
jgi:thiamine biosynthesis lipoprotein